MFVRIFAARTVEADRREAVEAEVAWLQSNMLARENQRRGHASREQRKRNRPQFDCFRSGADDQPDVGKTQPSP
jgi:hypothetical protein